MRTPVLHRMRPLACALVLLTAPLTGAAAQPTPAADHDQVRRELQASQQQLARLAARIAELNARVAGDELRDALRDGALTRPVLGVVLQADPERGVAIAAVSPLGPGNEVGLQPRDRLLAVDGARLDAADGNARLEQAQARLRELSPDRSVELTVERDGREQRYRLRPRPLAPAQRLQADPTALAEWAREMARSGTPLATYRIGEIRPVFPCTDGRDCLAEALLASGRWNGLRLFALNPELGDYFDSPRGVLVLESGADHPLRPGDVLLKVGDEAVDTPAAAMRALRGAGAQPREVVLLRRGAQQRIAVDATDLDVLPPLPALAPPPAAPLPATPRMPAAAPARAPAPSRESPAATAPSPPDPGGTAPRARL